LAEPFRELCLVLAAANLLRGGEEDGSKEEEPGYKKVFFKETCTSLKAKFTHKMCHNNVTGYARLWPTSV